MPHSIKLVKINPYRLQSIRGFLSLRHGESPRVADGGVGLQIWRLAANILNKQSWTADKEWSSSLGVWREANNLTL